MRLFRQYRPVLLFALLLAVCSVMVIRQMSANQSRHVELREAFILLHTRGYKPEAARLFERLLKEKDRLPPRLLLDDFQRSMALVDPAAKQPENLLWVYHWTVSNELEKRSEASLRKALKLAEEP